MANTQQTNDVFGFFNKFHFAKVQTGTITLKSDSEKSTRIEEWKLLPFFLLIYLVKLKSAINHRI